MSGVSVIHPFSRERDDRGSIMFQYFLDYYFDVIKMNPVLCRLTGDKCSGIQEESIYNT
jgi:hypothetical protein